MFPQKEGHMKKIITFLTALALLITFVPGGAALAKQPNGHHQAFEIAGYFEDLDSHPTSFDDNSVPGKVIMNWVQNTAMHGTFEGSCNTAFVMTVDAKDGTFESVGTTVFTGKVNGLPGESTQTFDVFGQFTAPFPGETVALVFSGPEQIVSGKGALSHLRGGFDLDVRIDQADPSVYKFAYEGEAWYEPDIND